VDARQQNDLKVKLTSNILIGDWKMKKVIIASVIFAMVVGLGIAFAAKPGNDLDGYNGNGAPSGYHKNLNIIGVPNDKNENYTGGNGSVVFVDRTGPTVFYVGGGDHYEIVDHDGTDGYVGANKPPSVDGTSPNPDTDQDYWAGIIFPYNAAYEENPEINTWRVQIWMRLVGPMDEKNNAKWSPYYWDGAYWQPITEPFTISKTKKFSLRTSDLLKDGYKDVYWLFEPGDKFRNCQMRIYFLPFEVD
jgi:hypothetical protein